MKKNEIMKSIDISSRFDYCLNTHKLVFVFQYLRFRFKYKNIENKKIYIERGSDIRFSHQAQVIIGSNVHIMRDFNAHFAGKVMIEDNVFFSRGCNINVHNALSIGKNCFFCEYVSIHDEDHVIEYNSEPIASRGFTTVPIIIGKNVYVGAKATILKGVTIGNNAVIGANAVVTRDVPANTIVGGIPARVVGEI